MDGTQAGKPDAARRTEALSAGGNLVLFLTFCNR